MNQNIWPCVSDMAPCPPWTWVSRWGKTQPLKSFSLVSGAGTTPLQPGCLGAEQPLAGVTSTEAAEEEGHHHDGGDPLQEVLVQGKYSVLVQPLRGERLGAWELLGHVVGEGRGGGGGMLHTRQGQWLEPMAALQPCGGCPACQDATCT